MQKQEKGCETHVSGKVNHDHLDDCIDYWQQLLALRHWNISWAIDDSKITAPRALMQIHPLRVRNHATIFIRESTFKTYPCCSYGLQQLLIHELVHLMLDPIAEEQHFQTQFYCKDKRQDEGRTRFTRTLEKVVEHTSQTIIKMGELFTPDKK